MNTVLRWIATGVVLIGGVELMFGGRGLWDWATGEPVGDELLIVAAATGDLERAKRALADGTPLEVYSCSGATPLALAAGVGDERLVELFLHEGADVDARLCCGRTALEFTTTQGCHAGTMRQLLEAGADPDGTKESGGWDPPLVNAASRGAQEAVEVLLSHGADPNPQLRGWSERSAVQAALDANYPDVAALLRRHGAVR